MSKKAIAEIECACGEKNKVPYKKPNAVTRATAKWTCANCWSKILTYITHTGTQGTYKQESFVMEPSDKLQRICAAKQAGVKPSDERSW